MTEPKQAIRKKLIFIDDDNNTALHVAAAFGRIEEVKKLILDDHKVDPENFLGWTPLMMATRNGHFEIVKFLLEERANSTHCNKFGFSVLFVAVASGRLDLLNFVLQHLLKGGVSRTAMQKIFSPVALSVLFNNIEVLQYLIQMSFCVNSIGVLADITPLSFAKMMDNQEIINLLLAKGAYEQEFTTQIPNSPFIPVSPLIYVHPSSPFVPLCAYPPVQRKSSELFSPCFTPGVSPIPPMALPQVFFPTNFAPICEPINTCITTPNSFCTPNYNYAYGPSHASF